MAAVSSSFLVLRHGYFIRNTSNFRFQSTKNFPHNRNFLTLRPSRRGYFRPPCTTCRHHRQEIQGSLSYVKASGNEEALAESAAQTAESGSPTIFDKIIEKEIPSSIVYEDDKVLAFRDINPQAPSHILLIPKHRDGLTQLSKAENRHVDILGHLLYTAKLIAEKEGLEGGYRVVINDGPNGCQSVYHLHLHILGGRQMKWPPG